MGARTGGGPTVLLTGGSGVVGGAAVEELRGAGPLICLVHRTPILAEGVECVRGDVATPKLGLTSRAFRELGRRVDAIVHVAGVTDYGADHETITETNVGGTATLLDLAAVRGVPFFHVGTIATELPFVEAAATNGTGSPDGTAFRQFDRRKYVLSKKTAERLVLESGLETTVIRLAQILGDSRTGAITRFQGVHVIMRFLFEGIVPVFPAHPEARVDVLPQDVVGRAIRTLVEHGFDDPICWLSAGDDALPIERVLDLVERYLLSRGCDFTRPRIVEPDMVERLIRPAFLGALPHSVRKRFDYALEVLAPVMVKHVFPSSLPELEALGLECDYDLEDVLWRNLEYWGQTIEIDRRLRARAS